MKTDVRLLLANLKAAARLGHPQSLEIALDGLRALPEVAGNHPLPDTFMRQVILPFGEILGSSSLGLAGLRPLINDPLAGVRAAAAAALGRRYFTSQEVTEQMLIQLARDPRPEVRQALAAALAASGAGSPGLPALVQAWLSDPNKRLRETALIVIASAGSPVTDGETVLNWLEPLRSDPDPQVRAALVAALISLAQSGLGEAVLDRLGRWAGVPEPNLWVISRALSAGWAASHAPRVRSILDSLEARSGPDSQISNARRALERHLKQ